MRRSPWRYETGISDPAFAAENNCMLAREGGRHSVWRNLDSGRMSAMPRYAEIRDLMARKICKDLGIAPP
jgi:mRNA interferase HicA